MDTVDLATTTPELYGRLEVVMENSFREATGDGAFIVCSGRITGPGDYLDSVAYWPGRLSQGDRVVVPDCPGHRFQHIDARDFADRNVDAAQQRLSGVFDGVGPVADLGETLRGIAELVVPKGTELGPVTPDELAAAGIRPWTGSGALPCW
ncbi:MAG: hypothetical protein ABW215_13230 [Kibdelosporangium sp.]